MKTFRNIIFAGLLLLPLSVHAELPWQFDQHTRYMALGDSLAAGYGAVPTTQGYVYGLYQSGVFDTVPHTIFSNVGIQKATSKVVLEYQVPQAILALQDVQDLPTFITLTVGGNDLLKLFEPGSNPAQVLNEFQTNLTAILIQLRTPLPHTRIYISNLYTIPEIPGADGIVPIFNGIVSGVAAYFGVPVADVYSAFWGKKGLLLISRNGADQFEVHPPTLATVSSPMRFRRLFSKQGWSNEIKVAHSWVALGGVSLGWVHYGSGSGHQADSHANRSSRARRHCCVT
jgi:lysophospholipase L1-like esterase